MCSLNKQNRTNILILELYFKYYVTSKSLNISRVLSIVTTVTN